MLRQNLNAMAAHTHPVLPFRSWVIACMWGEFLGIGFAGSAGVLHYQVLGEPRSAGQFALQIAWMLLAGAVEGSLLGWFQARVLAKTFPTFRKAQWIRLTMLAAVTAWLIGMLPSTLIGILQGSGTPPATQPPLGVILLFAAGGGLLLGAMFGAFQRPELARHLPKSLFWVLANALGWAIGLTWIFAAATWPDESTPWYWVVLSATLGGLLAGMTVGAVTGLFLQRMMAEDSGKKPSFSPNLS